jgi:glutaminyl-peptide cyclotransferase
MNTKYKYYILWLSVLIFTQIGCKSDSVKDQQSDKSDEIGRLGNLPVVDKDSLYHYVAKQVSFGPRVVNSDSHRECRDWLVDKFKQFGWEVQLQDFSAKAYTGEQLNGSNIIATWNGSARKRVLLCAHWDTRHVADYDENPERRNEPILGADDGGSGVAVLLEMARIIPEHEIQIGVDIVLFDAEDYGQDNGNNPDSWALGSQYWSSNLHKPGYKAEFGILLDMVGSKGPRFPKEGFSMQYASNIVEKVWALAGSMGYGHMFVNERDGFITDDHVYVNTKAGIPTINIINRRANQKFGVHWHTHMDDLNVIDKNSLRAVGKVVQRVLVDFDDGRF